MWFNELFPKIFNMSLAAGIVIALVLLARLPLKKAPKVFSHALWAVVLFRLLCPLTFESPVSIVPYTAAITSEQIDAVIPSVKFQTPADIAVNRADEPEDSGVSVFVSSEADGNVVITFVWLFGIAAMLICSLISLLRLKRKLAGAVRLRENIYSADHVATPFVIGVIRPKIYLPSSLSEREREYIILHERTHIRRLDHIVKLVSFLALALHWFNPLVWTAFILSGRDMEMSCDESVIKRMDGDIRGEYSASLLSLATGRKIIAGSPLAFTEGSTKARIKNVLGYKKPAFWIVIAALVAVIVLCAALAANPLKEQAASVVFPAYQEGKAEYNAKIYETDPFTLSIDLPDGWSVKLPAKEEREAADPNKSFTPVYMFSGETYMGYIGYNTFELYEGTTEDNFYRSVYNQLMLGSAVSWDNDYVPVKETENSCCATCRVRYRTAEEGESMAAGEDVFYPAILAYNKDLLVYVAIQFEENAVTGDELEAIAESITIS